ncbi:MAG: glycogen debranching enzyme N-terminal domain-containing protein [Acidobacteriia bacterium]|nr:glycogen debranching enzyme N-terminal domain-containing protein [Terriglobia bacterium]
MAPVDETVCHNLDLASRREWLETNGIGGFASSTITGLNTRRYHGLLVAATKPPVGRMVLLSKIEEALVIDGRRVELSCNRYPGVVHPHGYLHLKEFRRDPFPVFVYDAEVFILEKSVFMIHGENSTVVQYELRVPKNVRPTMCALELRPLIAFRDYHSTTHENGALNPLLEIEAGSVKVAPYQGLPPLRLAHTPGDVRGTGDWYRNFEYTIELERGLDYREDLFNPFVLRFDLNHNPRPTVVASVEGRSVESVEVARADEIQRRKKVLTAAPLKDPFVKELVEAADQFVVQRGKGSTVIAGYHWFADWGRDTMITLPGLTLVTGRPEAAKGILLEFATHVDRGMLPNRFPDAGETPEYNTVDATLWYFEAVRALVAYTEDYDFVRTKLYSVLADIIAWHERGTRYGIRVDGDGLLMAGEPGVQLTWMDAKVGDWVVTPRQGKPVEIQALWYNALRVMEDLAHHFGHDSDGSHYKELADRVRNAFSNLFWNESTGCLYDVVNSEVRDGSIRPNQIFTVSLHHKMLSPEKARSVVQAVEQHLLTPYGLRSLAPGDQQYRGRFEGGPFSRDSAYHQGTVWPWLMGPFITAYLEVNGRSAEARKRAEGWLAELRHYLENEGLGQIPEVFDGDAPQRPGGCLAQAWSVAEVLRALVEDVYSTAPAPARARATG